MKETNIQNKIRIDLSSRGDCVIFRNNVGMAYQGVLKGGTLFDARPVKFGLCEGSSDLIGYTKTKITADMVGKTVAIFTAIEVKAERGVASPAQRNFVSTINIAGGIGGIARSSGDAHQIIGRGVL